MLAAVAVPWFFTVFGGPWDHLIAFMAAYVVLGLIDRRYLRAVFWGVDLLALSAVGDPAQQRQPGLARDSAQTQT